MLTGYVLIPDIAGESKRSDHEEEIDFESISWGMAQAAMMQTGSGLTKSRANVTEVQLSKVFDASSVYIALACMQGKAFDEIVIKVRKDSGDEHIDYLTITLTNCTLASYSMNGSKGSEVIYDNFSIAFEKVEMLYIQQADEDHSEEAEHEIAYDIAAAAAA